MYESDEDGGARVQQRSTVIVPSCGPNDLATVAASRCDELLNSKLQCTKCGNLS